MSGSPARSSGLVVGSPVTGDDFFDRQDEMREFLRLLDEGAHVLVTAPRRIGKTSLIKEAEARVGDRYATLFVDLEACEDEASAVLKIVEAAREHRDLRQKIHDAFRNVLGGLLKSVDELSVSEVSLKLRDGIAADWQGKLGEVFLRLAEAEKPVILALDELPILLSRLLLAQGEVMAPEGVRRTHLFLSCIREASIRHRGRLRFVVSGSIGMEPLLDRARISDVMNTFTPLEIGPWDHPAALAYLLDRAHRNDLRFEEGAAERLLALLGAFIPHHVATFMRFLRADADRRDDRSCGLSDVDRVYREKMLSVHGHMELATYENRLDRMVSQELRGAALEMLTEAAITGRLTPRAGLRILESHGRTGPEARESLRFLLGVFDHDGYLRASGEAYVFVSHLLRDWWRHRFGFGYTPVDPG
jgi:uncharacterized protein